MPILLLGPWLQNTCESRATCQGGAVARASAVATENQGARAGGEGPVSASEADFGAAKADACTATPTDELANSDEESRDSSTSKQSNDRMTRSCSRRKDGSKALNATFNKTLVPHPSLGRG